MKSKDKINLTETTPNEIRRFVNLITERAITDHYLKNVRKSGNYLCVMYCYKWRNGHERFASSIYNKVRWSLELTQSGKSKF